MSNMPTNRTHQAKQILKDTIYVTIGTVCNDGTPWVSPLFVAYDKNYNFYWISPKNALHSKNIRKNGNISLVCYDSNAPKWEGVGVYFTAESSQVKNLKDSAYGLALIFKRLKEAIPPIRKFKGLYAYRVYKAVPKKAWITIAEKVSGEEVDAREEIDLDELIAGK